MALTPRTPTGGTVALALWMLADGKTIVQVKMTQAEHDAWGGKDSPPNSPGIGAVFLMAMGGILALNTLDGFAHTGDAWLDPNLGPVIAVSENYDFTYSNAIASDPGTTKQSTLTGIAVAMTGNRFRPALLNATTLTTFNVANSPPAPTLVQPISTIIPNSRSVTFDATGSGSGVGSTLTIAGTVTSNANSYFAGFCDTIFSTISGQTWNAASLTSRASPAVDANTPTDMSDMVAPGSGTHNLVQTFSAGVGNTGGFISAFGVNQTTPRRTAVVTATGIGTAPATGNITSATGDLGISCVFNRGNATNTTDAGWTQDWTFAAFDPASTGAHRAGAATISRTDTLSVSQNWAAVGVSLQAAPTFQPAWGTRSTHMINPVS